MLLVRSFSIKIFVSIMVEIMKIYLNVFVFLFFMSEKSFLLVSLKDNKAKKLASLLNSATARKVLEFLSKKDFATETDISKETGIPISTVHYNLKILKENKLVNEEEYHYSEKGKEVIHYKAANKYIIIAPDDEDSSVLDKIKGLIPSFVGLCVVSAVWLVSAFFSKTAYLSSAGDSFVAEVEPVALKAATDSVSSSAPSLAQASVQSSSVGGLLWWEPVFWFFIGGTFVILIIFLFKLVKSKFNK